MKTIKKKKKKKVSPKSKTRRKINKNTAITNIIESGEQFIKQLREKNSRYQSWEHCYLTFYQAHQQSKTSTLSDEMIDYLCLHLAFYLASWGMYRGSSFLLQTDYKVHKEIVLELFKKEYDILWGINWIDHLEDEEAFILLEKLSKNLSKKYQTIRQQVKIRTKFKEPMPNSDISLTLITKVLMGTMGCTPAYDRYFILAIKKYELSTPKFTIESFKKLLLFYQKNAKKFEKLRLSLKVREIAYPQMKILDMCLWQEGYNSIPII